MSSNPLKPTTLSDTLPIELWSRICLYACTDGGATGRSLSVASHFLYEVSRPYKYQIMVLEDTLSLSLFCDLIERNAPTPLIVRALYIRCADAEAVDSSDSEDEDIVIHGHFQLRSDSVLDPLRTVVTLVSPTLEILSIDVPWVIRPSFLWPLDGSVDNTFPCLNAISIDGPFSRSGNASTVKGPSPAVYPTISCLQCRVRHYLPTEIIILSSVATHFPNLSHLNVIMDPESDPQPSPEYLKAAFMLKNGDGFPAGIKEVMIDLGKSPLIHLSTARQDRVQNTNGFSKKRPR